MDQPTLYAAIARAGYTVQEFSDHPAFFGSWYVVLKRKESIFRISEDGRDSWLTFSMQTSTNEWETIKEADSHTFDLARMIAVCEEWLTSVG